MSGHETRERPPRRGEKGPQLEHFDAETGVVFCTHATADKPDAGEIESAHENLRHDDETRDSANRDYLRKLGKRDAETFERDRARGAR